MFLQCAEWVHCRYFVHVLAVYLQCSSSGHQLMPPVLLLHVRPSRAVQTFTQSTKLIRNTQPDTLSLGSQVWTAPTMDSNNHLGWWTYKRGNGMSSLLFHTDRLIFMTNQLCQRGPCIFINTSTHHQFQNQMHPRVLQYRVSMV